ncbi:MAG: GTPase Era [Gammaproteobacteria bacterium]|nr:GTPase Era [Gammaproteobacteria bacterium]MCH9715747.1 GTPase Era [Gammaproteobacteria bacterium]MCH9764191.1 GTPase Era [Gammaproteobacteria bacterium]
MVSTCGYIALVGRPNVGKSTLLNRILKEKLSITSRKPQTTRHIIRGILTEGESQMIYVDTPGIHQGGKQHMHRLMNQSAEATLYDVDVIVFVLEGTHFTEDDERVLNCIKKTDAPCILVLNKVDQVEDKNTLLPALSTLSQKHDFLNIIPLSAKTGVGVDDLQALLKPLMPEAPHLFEADQFTDRSQRFLCAELLREKIFRFTGQELPYSTTVDIESYEETEKLVKIQALILVERDNHKRMIIGERGSRLKTIASQARLDMERLLGQPVFLQCWCKVKSGWSDDARILKQLGYEN